MMILQVPGIANETPRTRARAPHAALKDNFRLMVPAQCYVGGI